MLKVEHALTTIFGKWGEFVADHPLVTIIASLSVGIGASIPMMRITSETDTQQLFAPKVM